MASYDTSVIIKCLNGDKDACDVILSDDNCVIPPTTWEEVTWKTRPEHMMMRNEIADHCRIYTYEIQPFSNFDVQDDINAFVDKIKTDWLNGIPKRGRGAAEYNKKLRYFKRRCIGSGNVPHRLNDYRIYKESNVLGEFGVVDELRSADWAQTDQGCQIIYEEVMRSLPEPYREERKIVAKYYKA